MPAANRLGEEGQGFKIAMQTLDNTRPGTAAGAVGVARAAFEHAVEYARERVQFGQPIAMNQGVNFLSPTWRPRSRRRGCSSGRPPGCSTRAQRGDAAVVLREALRRRHGDEGHDRRRADLRRLRLHEGVPGREADARREAVPDLRGHVADPAARDRPGDLLAARRREAGWRAPLHSTTCASRQGLVRSGSATGVAAVPGRCSRSGWWCWRSSPRSAAPCSDSSSPARRAGSRRASRSTASTSAA